MGRSTFRRHQATIYGQQAVSAPVLPYVLDDIDDFAVNEDASDSTFDLDDVFFSPLGKTFTYEVLTNTNESLVDASIDVDGHTLVLDYLANQNGVATITIRATEADTLEQVTDEFIVTVNAINDAPTVANPVADFAVNEDAADTVIDLRAVFQDAETADADLVYSVTSNSNPTLVTATVDNTTDTLTLDYQSNQSGTATIVVRATDAGSLYAEDSFVLTVNAVNDAPVASNPIADFAVFEFDEPDYIDLTAVFTDAEQSSSALTYTVHANDNPTLVQAVIEDGTTLALYYQLFQDGAANITVRATDASSATGDDTFTVTVNPRVTASGTALPDLELDQYDTADLTYDISDYFVAPAGVATYEVFSTNSTFADATLSGTDVTVALTGYSGAVITLRCTDVNGYEFERIFSVKRKLKPIWVDFTTGQHSWVVEASSAGSWTSGVGFVGASPSDQAKIELPIAAGFSSSNITDVYLFWTASNQTGSSTNNRIRWYNSSNVLQATHTLNSDGLSGVRVWHFTVTGSIARIRVEWDIDSANLDAFYGALLIPGTGTQPSLPTGWTLIDDNYFQSNMFWNYLNGGEETEAELVADYNLTMTALTRKQSEGTRDDFYAEGVTIAPQYLLTLGIHNPSDILALDGTVTGATASNPYSNQLGWRTVAQGADIDYLAANHPDVWLRTTGGDIIKSEGGTFVRLDPMNKYIQWWSINRMKETQRSGDSLLREGWQGVAWDTLRAIRDHSSLANYANDAAWRAGVAEYIGLFFEFMNAQGRKTFGNVSGLTSYSYLDDYKPYLDFIMFEDAFMAGVGTYKSTTNWTNDLDRIIALQAEGKGVFAVCSVSSEASTSDIQFGVASFMLCANGLASFRASNWSGSNYYEYWTHSSMTTAQQLGLPMGAYYVESGNVRRRDFLFGYVQADPVAHTGTITLYPVRPS